MHGTDVRFIYTGWTHCDPHWSWDRRNAGLAYYDLWHVIDGAGRVTGDGGAFPIRRGDVILYPPHGTFSAEQDPENRLMVSYTYFQAEPQSETEKWLRRTTRPCLRLSHPTPEWMSDLLRRMWDGQQGRAKPGNAEIWLSAALLEIRRLQAQPGPGTVPDRRRPDMMRLLERIQRDPGHCGSVEDWITSLGVSASTFQRRFRRLTGQSPQAYRMTARMERARALLSFSERTLAQIADLLGFSDAFAFGKQFKRHVGVSPGEWRKGKRATDA